MCQIQDYDTGVGYSWEFYGHFRRITENDTTTNVVYTDTVTRETNPSMTGEQLHYNVVNSKIKSGTAVLCSKDYENNGYKYLSGHSYLIENTSDTEDIMLEASDISNFATEDYVTGITGKLSDLETDAKDNLVLAINEVKNSGGSSEELYWDGETDETGKAIIAKVHNAFVNDNVILPLKLIIELESSKIALNLSAIKLSTKGGGLEFEGYNYSSNHYEPPKVIRRHYSYEVTDGVVTWLSIYMFSSTISPILASNDNKGYYGNNDTVLTLGNYTEFKPTGDYNPATKKYVDDLLKGYSGYDESKTQVLKNINGTFTWVDE
jgi:hypothetical protein